MNILSKILFVLFLFTWLVLSDESNFQKGELPRGAKVNSDYISSWHLPLKYAPKGYVISEFLKIQNPDEDSIYVDSYKLENMKYLVHSHYCIYRSSKDAMKYGLSVFKAKCRNRKNNSKTSSTPPRSCVKINLDDFSYISDRNYNERLSEVYVNIIHGRVFFRFNVIG